MGVNDIRDAFNAHGVPKDPALAPNAVRCVAVRMSYIDADGQGNVKRDHQLVELDVVRAADNTSKTLRLVIPCSDSIHVNVAAAAKKELNNGEPK